MSNEIKPSIGELLEEYGETEVSAEFLGGSEQKDGPTCKGKRSFTERTVFKAVKIEKTIECTWAE